MRNIIGLGVRLRLAISNFRNKPKGRVSDNKAISMTLHGKNEKALPCVEADY